MPAFSHRSLSSRKQRTWVSAPHQQVFGPHAGCHTPWSTLKCLIKSKADDVEIIGPGVPCEMGILGYRRVVKGPYIPLPCVAIREVLAGVIKEVSPQLQPREHLRLRAFLRPLGKQVLCLDSEHILPARREKARPWSQRRALSLSEAAHLANASPGTQYGQGGFPSPGAPARAGPVSISTADMNSLCPARSRSVSRPCLVTCLVPVLYEGGLAIPWKGRFS
jgi:hypothetical protein